MIPFRDLADESEDERIRQIGEKAMREKLTVGFVTDDESGKADRYIRKLQERFPGIRVVGRGNGPVAETVWVMRWSYMDNVEGYLEVGLNESGEVVVNHPDLKPDADGVGHIVFSPNQARHLAALLEKHANESETAERERIETARRKAAEAIPVDRSSRVLTDAVRRSYRHTVCGSVTRMGLSLAETYARDPGFYSGTFCCACGKHFPLDQFVWEGTSEKLGS